MTTNQKLEMRRAQLPIPTNIMTRQILGYPINPMVLLNTAKRVI